MTQPRGLRGSDLRGAVRLATDATAGLTDLVEAMHEGVGRLSSPITPLEMGRTGGLSGVIYKTIRGVTHVVGGSVDALLGLLTPSLSRDDTSRERAAVVAALNGVLGDYLAATSNPLATAMAFRERGRALTLDKAALADCLPQSGRCLLILMHGLCMSDLQWQRDDHDHGTALERDLGFTPVYLHYNSGLHISVNGRLLSRQLELLLDQWPHPVDRLILLGHSMGGLVARSALHYASLGDHRWTERVSDLVFLGTPHHGAPLERVGNWVDVVLGKTPYAKPFARLGRIRSAGITDLRWGNLVDEDWLGRDRFARSADRRQHLPLPNGRIRCFAAAATLGRQSGDIKDRLLGDGIVPLDSALGRHQSADRTLTFPEDCLWIGYEMSHMTLLSHASVYAQLKAWLG